MMDPPDKVDLVRAAHHAERLHRERLLVWFVAKWGCSREVARHYLGQYDWDYSEASVGYFLDHRVVDYPR